MKTTKMLAITMVDGRIFHVPLEVIAKARATYYAAKDKDTTYESEFEYVMEDSYEAIDWYANNMNPDEVMAHAQLVYTPKLEPFERAEASEHNIVEVSLK